jgi:hypothetical protein
MMLMMMMMMMMFKFGLTMRLEWCNIAFLGLRHDIIDDCNGRDDRCGRNESIINPKQRCS